MAKSYKTIIAATEGLYKEKGSKFLAYAFPVQNLIEVKKHVDALKKEYYDARHHCYAHIIEDGSQQLVRANDDGEPNHSAGDPILGQIKSFELTNTLVVVVRYFGGTKLGVSGLIHAYRVAAEEALAKAKIETVYIKTVFDLEYAYEKTSNVMRVLNDHDVEIINQEFTDMCRLTGKIEPERFEMLQSKLKLLSVNATKN